MAITYTLLEQQLTDLSSQVDALRREFDLFRGYANRQFTSINERLDSIETQLANTVTKDDLMMVYEEITAKSEANFNYLVSLITAQQQSPQS